MILASTPGQRATKTPALLTVFIYPQTCALREFGVHVALVLEDELLAEPCPVSDSGNHPSSEFQKRKKGVIAAYEPKASKQCMGKQLLLQAIRNGRTSAPGRRSAGLGGCGSTTGLTWPATLPPSEGFNERASADCVGL